MTLHQRSHDQGETFRIPAWKMNKAMRVTTVKIIEIQVTDFEIT